MVPERAPTTGTASSKNPERSSRSRFSGFSEMLIPAECSCRNSPPTARRIVPARQLKSGPSAITLADAVVNTFKSL